MASGLSEDEFHRMQLQLIELRTAKYELEATNKKQEREIQSLKDAAETSEKELQKAQKAINKSKKAKEVEMLLQEADNLQMKLQSQEDDFRVQNQTLMQELTNLVSSNEDLEKQLSELKENKGGNQGASEVSSHLEDEVRRLQAQNAALQKSLSEMQSKTLSKSENEDDSEAAESVTTSDGNITDVETLQKKIDELKLSVDTEAEEKRMIKQKLSENEESHKEEVKSLKDELEKLTEKLKKKQESYVQLQGEKESSFRDLNAKLIELHFSKDRDQKYYTDQISKLQQEIAKYQKIQDEIKSNSDQAIKQLQNKMAQMQQQINAADIIENQHIQERTQKYESHVKELQSQILVLTQKRDDLSAQLEESQKASEMASQQLLHLQQDRDKQIQSAQEANKLAEKRKAMLDELAIEYQKDGDKHREQMLTMENDYEVRLKTLQQKLDQEQKKHAELEKLKSTLEEKQTEINSLSEKCGWLERKLSDTEGSLDKTLDENETTLLSLKTDHEEEITSLKTEHSTQIEQLTNTFQAEIKSLKESEESQKQVITNLEEEVKKFKQEIKDGVNEKKVHEKKGKSVLKDLKKQLHAERKRGDKLQERLQEVLSNGSHNKSIEDLFRTPDMMSDSWREDQSSVSSWSGGGTLASYGTNPSVMSTSPQSSPMSPSSEFPGTVRNEGLENESKELLGRLAAVQQEKWDLEEKVRHLETSTAAMANDLIEKAKIIEHYVMESRTDMKHNNSQPDDKITFKKVLDLVNKTDEHGLREMNKKLQNMLEETLTKNMHLQKDLETMSQEVVRLSKLPHHVDARVKNSEQNSITPKQDSSNCSNNTDGQTDSIKCSTVNGAVS
ncbi:GRIP1-associated protein 1-like isoform X1 [Ruditapes philippinarum]|uniref:GRIP1-associated protein 1-like isoform X1 n=1 Tax=Ruditapes philippinarum TaxID=129788 RepID=UPI00295AA649|nr:GRIP1-associated protein 1-like isoform X1 [Ruditapes philippinarum]